MACWLIMRDFPSTVRSAERAVYQLPGSYRQYDVGLPFEFGRLRTSLGLVLEVLQTHLEEFGACYRCHLDVFRMSFGHAFGCPQIVFKTRGGGAQLAMHATP